MLETLDSIWWSSLTGNGNCTDVPMLLRTMATGIEPDADLALAELRDLVCHQGSVYEASAYVVPFLFELLEAAHNDAFALNLLSLLAELGDGQSYLAVHGDMPAYDKTRETEDFQHRLNTEIGWVRNTREAIAEGAPTLARLLSHKAGSIRAWAAYTVGRSKRQSAVHDLLLRLDLEGHPSVLATVLLVLSDSEVEQAISAAEVYLNSEVLVLKYAASIVLARAQRSEVSEEVVDFLTSVLMDADVIESEFDELDLFPHQAVRDMAELAVEAFECIGSQRTAKAIPKLLACLKNMPDAYVDDPLNALLSAAFGSGGIAPEELSEQQRELLKTLISYPNMWTVPHSREHQFGRHGLPGSAEAIGQLMGSTTTTTKTTTS
jgi:hypothetical protein